MHVLNTVLRCQSEDALRARVVEEPDAVAAALRHAAPAELFGALLSTLECAQPGDEGAVLYGSTAAAYAHIQANILTTTQRSQLDEELEARASAARAMARLVLARAATPSEWRDAAHCVYGEFSGHVDNGEGEE